MSKSQNESKNDQHQFWQMVFETFKSSGLSIRRFCKQEGLTEASFYFWRKKLANAKESKSAKKGDCQPEPFIRVALPKDNHEYLELVLVSGNTLRISSGTDSETLTGVLSSLQEAGLC